MCKEIYFLIEPLLSFIKVGFQVGYLLCFITRYGILLLQCQQVCSRRAEGGPTSYNVLSINWTKTFLHSVLKYRTSSIYATGSKQGETKRWQYYNVVLVYFEIYLVWWTFQLFIHCSQQSNLTTELCSLLCCGIRVIAGWIMFWGNQSKKLLYQKQAFTSGVLISVLFWPQRTKPDCEFWLNKRKHFVYEVIETKSVY